MSIRRESAGQAIYQVLRDQIIEGKLRPFTRLREPELAVRLSVSRTPLREALRHLDAEGFVERLPTGGVMVAGIDPDDIRDLFSVRAVLEGHLVREVAAHASARDVAELYQFLDRMDKLQAYPEEVIRMGLDFHDCLAMMAGNRRCREILRQIRRHIDRYWAVTTANRPDRVRAVSDEHRRVVDAIRDGDPVRAEAAMQAHLGMGAAVCIEAATLEARRIADGTPPEEEAG